MDGTCREQTLDWLLVDNQDLSSLGSLLRSFGSDDNIYIKDNGRLCLSTISSDWINRDKSYIEYLLSQVCACVPQTSWFGSPRLTCDGIVS